MLNDLRQFASAQNLPDLEAALTGVGGLVFNLVGAVIDILFGFIGGLAGGAILGPRRATA